MVSTVIAFLKALPALIQIFNWIKNELKEDPVEYLKKLQEVMALLKPGSSVGEKLSAAQKIQDLIRRK